MCNLNKNGKAPSKAELNAILEKNGLGPKRESLAAETLQAIRLSKAPQVLSLSEVQKVLGVCRTTLYSNFLSCPDFPAFRIGGRVLVETEALQSWLSDRTTEAVSNRTGSIN